MNEEKTPLPAMDFSTFVMSLTTNALMAMGEIPVDEAGRKQVSLPLAQQSIDILEILKVKTQGNLEESEAQLLEHNLFQLRLRFVAVSKDPNQD